MELKPIFSKKGQLNLLAPAVLALVFAAIILTIGLVINQEIRDTDIVSQDVTGSASNETLATVTEAGEDFANVGLPAVTCSISVVHNATDGVVIPATNYTQTNCNLASNTDTDINFNNTNWNVTYTYAYGGSAFTASNDTVVGLGTFADFWGIIVLAIIAVVVIGLLLTVFGGRKAR